MNAFSFKRMKNMANLVQRLLAYDPILPLVERIFLLKRHFNPRELQPIFIVGPPRTGSTLLFELLISMYRTAYLTNLSSLLFKSPILATKLQKSIGFFHSFSGQSKYGFIPGLTAPSEAGVLFRHWFGDEKDTQHQTYDLRHVRIVRSSVNTISDTMRGPFISKNLNNSVRLTRINQVFPNAMYLFMRRDPLYTAQSILLSRRNLFGNDRYWFSVKPPNYQKIADLDPLEQVVYQIKSIEDYIRDVFREQKIVNVMEICYEELCSNWQIVLEQIAKLCQKYGITLEKKDQILDITLNKSQKQLLNNNEFRKLRVIVNKLYYKDWQK